MNPALLPILELQDVSLTRAGRPVLKKINWTVRPGEHWVLCGHNGSGKTSLLEIVLGYLWASRGSVHVMGEQYGKTLLPELRKRIGFVAPWVLEHMRPWETAAEVVASGLQAGIEYRHRLSRFDAARINRFLRFFNCRQYEKVSFGSLSSGERMKIILARAMMAQPSLLVLDEPFASLDMGARWDLTRKLQQLAALKKPPAMILVTHHLEEIPSFFTHALILKEGRIFASGRRREVLKKDILLKAFRL